MRIRPGACEGGSEYLAKHGRMNSLRNCYVQFREAIRRGTTHVRGHIDVGVFGLAELEDAARAREAFGTCWTSSMSPCPQTAS